MGTYTIIVSDSHVNSTVAICPKTVRKDDGGTYHASPRQESLLESFQDFTNRVKKLKGKKVLIINGDMTELDSKDRSTQLITRNSATVLSMCISVYEPLIDAVNKVIIIRGTSAHTGESSWSEELIGKYFKDHAHVVTPDDEAEVYSWWQLRATIGSRKFDVAHHGRVGRLPWNRGTGALKKAAETEADYYRMESSPPDLVIRGHNHIVEDSGDNYRPIHAWTLPAWTYGTEYFYRVGLENKIADVGGFIIDCEGEYKKPEVVLYRPYTGKIWAMTI